MQPLEDTERTMDVTKIGTSALERAADEFANNPLLTGAASRLFDLRDRAVVVQEQTMSLLNVPTAAHIERLTRRVRSVSQRLEGIEDAVDRVAQDTSVAGIEARLSAIEEQLAAISDALAVRSA
jgi:hypothetical protein